VQAQFSRAKAKYTRHSSSLCKPTRDPRRGTSAAWALENPGAPSERTQELEDRARGHVVGVRGFEPRASWSQTRQIP
jgi:hypothetical protein